MTIVANSIANDGAYLSAGSVFYPIQETDISIEKEILTFKCRDRKVKVNVYFEFLNTDTVAKTMKVGFQVPVASGADVPMEDKRSPLVENFLTMFEGKILPYQLKIASSEDGVLKNPEDVELDIEDSGVHVFVFDINFKPGINVIRHSYEGISNASVMSNEEYSYILTTGGKHKCPE